MATNPNLNYILNGRIIDPQDEPLEGLVVHAFHQETQTPSIPLGYGSVTDAQGYYLIHFWTDDYESDGPDVFIQVHDGNELLGTSQVTPNAQNQISIDLQLDHATPEPDKAPRQVSGVVSDAQDDPLSGVTVQVFDCDLRYERALGQSKTDKYGFYRIEYAIRQLRRREKDNADLVLKAFAADGSVLGVSAVSFDAPPTTEIDLIVPAEVLQPPSLFERIKRDLTPLLEDLTLEELEQNQQHQDLSFLSGETGYEEDTLARYVIAHRLAAQSMRAEFWFVLLGGSLYKFTPDQSLDEQLSGILDALPALDAAPVRKSFARGFNQNEISESFRGQVDDWTAVFLELVASRTVRDSAEPTFVKSALEHAAITDPGKQKQFAHLFNEHKAFTPELLAALEQDQTFNDTEIADLYTSYQLVELTESDFSVVGMLKDEFDVRHPTKIRLLAKQSQSEWVALIEAKHTAGAIKLPIAVNDIDGLITLPEASVYGKMLELRFRQAFPTTAFSGGLGRALQNGGANELYQPEELNGFLDGHENFELLNTPVDDFFDNHLHPDFQSLAEDKNFRLGLKAVQRVFKLAPTFEMTDLLLADDLHSAQKIYRLGKSKFVQRYADRPGFGKSLAQLIWNRAADTYAAVLTIIADLKALEAAGSPLALRESSAELANFFNWNNLFRTGDQCECEHCRSVISPAAYHADLLMFLKDRYAKNSYDSVKDVLFLRRPDLGYLELNCVNALTSLPYIDVVCEVLEDVVAAGENDLALSFSVMPTDSATAKYTVETAFAAHSISLGADFTLSQVYPDDLDLWVAHGDDITYLLKKKTTPNFFAEILRNTKTSAAELRAYPQYVNPTAYARLRAAKYPLSLPFDLFAEEAKAAFRKTNLQRWDLMRVLRGAAAPNNPTGGEIAAEYFGISADPGTDFDEKRLILDDDYTVAGQQAVWGETGADWLDAVSNVKNFLRKTGLEYNDLLTLLDLKFINPSDSISIQHLDASCDIDQKVIQILDTASLDRMHRFLRLWKKLDTWKMWELDLVIRHPRIGNGILDEAFLIELCYLDQLKERLGKKASVEQVCALFGDLNTETHFTELYEKREDALYQELFLNKRLINPLDPAFQLDPSTGDLAAGESISAHHPVVLAALGIREADLLIFQGLIKTPDGTLYDDLTLASLSFLWRHAWLSELLKFTAKEWEILLKLFQHDRLTFGGPREAQEFVARIDHLTATEFEPDELNWLLAADRLAQAAVAEDTAARFLAALRTDLQAIRAENDPAQYDFLIATPPTDVDSLITLLTSLLQKLNRDEAATQFFIATLRDEVSLETQVEGLLDFDFPAAMKNAIRISYDESAGVMRFTGLMTAEEQKVLLNHPSLVDVTGKTAYQEAIEELYTRPRLALKFFEPAFSAPLANLPEAVDFNALADPALALKISYDAERRLLCFAGIMSKDEKTALDALSADEDYLDAVNSLTTQPGLVALPDARIWLLDADLKSPLRDLEKPELDHLAQNLATAITKALAYLSQTASENTVLQQCSAQLELSEALTHHLLTSYAVLPATLMQDLTGAFADTAGVVDYATLTSTFDGWFWANRVTTILKTWNITLAELEKITALTAGARLLDFLTLPLDDSGAIAPLNRFLRTSRLLRVRDSLPETEITLLEVLENLSTGAYVTTADFGTDVERINEDWLADDVEAFTSTLDLAYPADYLLAESWERLRRAFYFLDNLNASASTAQSFAAAAMSDTHAKTLKELLRSKFGVETWLTLCTEIQDVLRERKRDALTAYLLTQPKPADAPSGKWENTNDLYAYYLLDVEMSSCQLTSRLVQGSGSVQLFVQRCFMGLEPDVEVIADGDDGDSAWHWWKWMSKYRVWEANRKVFLWPENWIEPELKPDRSSFFKDLENELLQNEINQDNVETAFLNYLEKLDGVAQLEIAGFYQEDDGDNTILHVLGRSIGVEPHLYYYRTYDYRQWTPWEKIELDIQGDYLIPAVINKRLYLFWPVFTEMSDEGENSTITIPAVTDAEQPNVNVQQTSKKLKLQMAVSEYRQGQWTPKRVSKDFDTSKESYTVEIVKQHYSFFPIDMSETKGRFGIRYFGYSLGSDNNTYAKLSGAFEIAGCKGVPERVEPFGRFAHVIRPERTATGDYTIFSKWIEHERVAESSDGTDPDNDFVLEHFANLPSNWRFTQVLKQTPGFFKVAPPWHLSYPDKYWLDMPKEYLNNLTGQKATPIATWLPFFYNDKKRTFFVLPSLWGGPQSSLVQDGGSVRYYYPDIKNGFRELENFFAGLVQTWVEQFDISTLTLVQRYKVEIFLHQQFPQQTLLPIAPWSYTDEQIKDLTERWLMRSLYIFLGALSLKLFRFRQFHFKNFYHPFVCELAQLVYDPLQGIPALMSRKTQMQNTGFRFGQTYQPTRWVVEPKTGKFYPREMIDFTPDGAYSPYNWELFFHAPLMVANSLSRNQRFEEARDWYHFIFNPIGVDSPIPGGSPMSKYWITKPFFQTTGPQYLQQRIDNLMRMLAGDSSVPGYSAQAKKDLEDQVLDWRTNPFEPHRIANYRTVAYQKTVVMKYLDNLVAWGDYLFRQDSMESINEATQLYILAAEILGPRPKSIPPQAKPPVESFNELETEFDKFSNALVEVENLIPPLGGTGSSSANTPPLPTLYFCIPRNDIMLEYWDTVADRLYKIRHCMNIEGVVRQLALFEPPIDPAALVKAVAGGIDISTALSDLNAPLPLYRFNTLLQKANEVCNDVKALGGALLAALEKKDAEALGLLRQSHELCLLEAVKAVRETQIEEAKENLEGLKRSKAITEVKRNYYRDIDKLIDQEELHLNKLGKAHKFQEQAQGVKLTASIISLLPAIDLGASGFGGTPIAKFKFGGLELGQAAGLAAEVLSFLSLMASNDSAMASSQASFDRRWDDWKLQERLADKELDQMDTQIAAAELRIAIAEKELENHVIQIENAKASDAFMRSKYTNEELYQWQVGQISGVYFQSYKLAYDLAKQAERCFRFELGLQDSSYINFGYWDSLKKGLLSGEKLQYDLRRLETAYLERNRREFELTKHISLALLDPLALVTLRETGRCFISLPEEILDLDYPGHYFRRIKSVSLTLPCVAGPYTTISCTLRLLKNSIRINTANGNDGYPRNTDDDGLPADDVRFIENSVPVKAIAASNAQNDSGVFELNFRDERYLPFEGAGAISEWSLELFNDLFSNNPDYGRPLRQFDYGTISDAILHVKYTAREDAGLFKNGVVSHLREYFSLDGSTHSMRMFDLRNEFPTQWHRFLNPTDPLDGNVFELEMSHKLFPWRDQGKTLQVNTIWLLARCMDEDGYEIVMALPPAGTCTLALAPSEQYGGLHFGEKDVATAGIEIMPTGPAVKWQFAMTSSGDGDFQVEDVLLVLGYDWYQE